MAEADRGFYYCDNNFNPSFNQFHDDNSIDEGHAGTGRAPRLD